MNSLARYKDHVAAMARKLEEVAEAYHDLADAATLSDDPNFVALVLSVGEQLTDRMEPMSTMLDVIRRACKKEMAAQIEHAQWPIIPWKDCYGTKTEVRNK